MWMRAKITPVGLYNYDRTVFDYFRVPSDPAGLDRGTILDAILVETSDLSVSVFSSPESFKEAVRLWVAKNFGVWQELWETMNYDYNPIWNYDREEHGKDRDDGKNKETPDITIVDDYTRNLKDNDTTDNHKTVGAFNEGMADSEHLHTDYNGKATGETHNKNKRTGNITNEHHNVLKHDFHAYGNIGVTTTQDMIKQQREIVQFNITDYIVQDFKRHFCIMVY